MVMFKKLYKYYRQSEIFKHFTNLQRTATKVPLHTIFSVTVILSDKQCNTRIRKSTDNPQTTTINTLPNQENDNKDLSM